MVFTVGTGEACWTPNKCFLILSSFWSQSSGRNMIFKLVKMLWVFLRWPVKGRKLVKMSFTPLMWSGCSKLHVEVKETFITVLMPVFNAWQDFLIMLMRVGFNDLFNINRWERQRPLATDTKNLKSTLVCPSGTCLPVRPFPPHREKPIYGMMPGPHLKPEDQPCGCSGLSAAGNLPIRAQKFMGVFSCCCFLVTTNLAATAASRFNRAMALPRWKYICVVCLLKELIYKNQHVGKW